MNDNCVMQKYNTELYHHGVKGMRWGVRKAKRQALKAHDRKVKDDWNQAKKDAKAGNIDKNSDRYKKAKAANTTRVLEKQFLYDTFRANARDKINRGESATNAYMSEFGKQVLTGAVISAAATAGSMLVMKWLNN